MADAVYAVSLLPDRSSTDGAVAIGANSLTMMAAARLRGFRCAAVGRSHAGHDRILIGHSWRQADGRH